MGLPASALRSPRASAAPPQGTRSPSDGTVSRSRRATSRPFGAAAVAADQTPVPVTSRPRRSSRQSSPTRRAASAGVVEAPADRLETAGVDIDALEHGQRRSPAAGPARPGVRLPRQREPVVDVERRHLGLDPDPGRSAPGCSPRSTGAPTRTCIRSMRASPRSSSRRCAAAASLRAVGDRQRVVAWRRSRRRRRSILSGRALRRRLGQRRRQVDARRPAAGSRASTSRSAAARRR